MIPVRKVMEEMCPSPVARKLRINRRVPGGRSVWSGCGTMDGLNRAADSKEYSQLARHWGRTHFLHHFSNRYHPSRSTHRGINPQWLPHRAAPDPKPRVREGAVRAETL